MGLFGGKKGSGKAADGGAHGKSSDGVDETHDKQKSLSAHTAKPLDVKAQAIIGNIVFSTDEIYAYYQLPVTVYDFLSSREKVSKSSSMERAFVALMRGRDENLDVHLLVITTPINVNAWEDTYRRMTRDWPKRPGFEAMVQNQLNMLLNSNESFFEKKVLLGVKLSNRHEFDINRANPLQHGMSAALEYMSEFFQGLTRTDEVAIEKAEVDSAQRQEKEIYGIISSSTLAGERMSAEELGLTIKRTLYPSMPVPYMSVNPDNHYGRGDLISEMSGIIHTKDPKAIRIEQCIDGEIMEGYRAALTFKKFPSEMNIPPATPWLYAAIFNPSAAPFDISARFSLIPNKAMKKKVARKIADTKDAMQNAAGVGEMASTAVQDDYYAAQDMEGMLEKDDRPWLQGTFRIIVYAPTLDLLEQYVSEITTIYNEQYQIELLWSFHDQLPLLLESMPGDSLRESSFQQTATVNLLTSSGFQILNQVGDTD